MRTIISSRLVMRPWHLDDADFLFDLESRPETTQYLGPHARPMVGRHEAVESIHRRRALDHPIHGIWVMSDRATGELLGNLLLKPAPVSAGVERVAPVEIGWHLHPDAQGRGYATEAAEAVLNDAALRGLDAVIAVTDPRNASSQRVCERLGMTACGMTTDFYDELNLLFQKSLLSRAATAAAG